MFKKKYTMKKVLFIVIAIGLFSCTANQKARQYGGKEDVVLEPNEVLINITWKESNMWMLTEDTATHLKHFRESSSWGVWNGEITIHNPEK